MKTMLAFSPQKRLRALSWIAAISMAATTLGAQTATPRIASEITSSELTPLKGSLHPRAQAQFDTGRLPTDTKLSGISIVFNRTAAQQADLDALIAAQQNPASPLYHQWLNPDQFAARFGMAEADLAKVEAWLQQQGFSIDSVARSRNMIRFSGTVRQVELAFQTQMHYYKSGGEQHFAPSTELTIPAALASTVLAIRNLDDFQPRSHAVAHPSFTSSQSTSVFFAPPDIVTTYNLQPLYKAGYNGAGQSITIVGQSAITVSDIENFQNAASLTVKDPVLVLVPGTGTSTINPQGTNRGDMLESDLDLEWSSAMAPGAQINFVYTGSNKSYGVFDSMQYAIDEKIGNIISASYGDCETDLGSSSLTSLDTIIQQAASQGQSVISSSGDWGSTECSGITTLTTAQQQALAVSYPASSPYVTALGGTEISTANSAYEAQGQGYWAAKSSSDVISSALQYIPEMAWNNDSTSGLSSGGGGASAFFSKPSYQSVLTPADGKRDVPDIALYSSTSMPGYLYCSSDTSTQITGSCTNGFRDSSNKNLTVAGGTSFAAPIFAGMLAIINQKAGYTSGQGLVNTQLYALATSGSTYTAAAGFHDITSGDNKCSGGTTLCGSGGQGFSAGSGYDQVTGLGSFDLDLLATAWPVSTSSLIATTTTVVPSNTAPSVNTAVNFTVTVTSATGSTIPGGTVTLVIDGGTASGGQADVTGTLTANGTYVYAATFTTTGAHQIVAKYAGDTTHAASTGVGSVTIASTSSGKGTIALSPSSATLTVSRGGSGSETITVTPSGGYTGTVLLSVSSSSSALNTLCYDFTNITTAGYGPVTITGTAAGTQTLTLDTNAAHCASSSAQKGSGKAMHRLGSATTAKNNGSPLPAAIAFAGLLLVGFIGRYSRKFGAFAGLIALAAVGLSLSACGGGSSSSTTVSNPPKGTYTMTVTGQDSATSTITGTTTFTFVIN